MGFRFRQSIRLAKGVRLNIGKRGASVSLGRRGFTYNVGSKGGRATLGAPGTGVSYQTQRHPIHFGKVIGLMLLAGFLVYCFA